MFASHPDPALPPPPHKSASSLRLAPPRSGHLQRRYGVAWIVTGFSFLFPLDVQVSAIDL